MKLILTIFRKEALDNLRDRRSISSSLLTPLFMPVFLIALIMVVGRTVMSDIIEKPLDLPVSGAEYAPGLIDYLKTHNVNILPAPADPKAAVREGEVNVVLVIGPGYGKAFEEGKAAPIQMVLDTTRQSASPYIERTRSLVGSYAQTIATLRLHARGVDPRLLEVLSVEKVDLATPQSNAVIFLNMLPFLLTMVVFVGGMYVIIDTTAGERERGSLEPLLINPVPRRTFVLGKLLASLPFAVGTLALSLFLFWVGFTVVPLEEYTGMRMNISADVLINTFWLTLPVVLLASAMQMVVASFTRSFKEAQTYLSFLPLIVSLPGAFLAFLPVKTTLDVSLIPIYSQSVMITQILRGETLIPLNAVVATVTTLVASVVVTYVAIRLYERESILFGGK